MQALEQLARFQDRERLGFRAAFENFERRFASIAVAGRDAVKFGVVNFSRGLQSAKNHRPSNLQGAQIALGKSFSGKISRRDRKLFGIERPQVIREQSDLFELRRRRSNRFTNFSECRRIRIL